MAEQLSIRIKIGDRDYPMKVVAKDEGLLRQAGKILNERLRRFKEQFGIDDKQDLLAMVAFDCLVEKMQYSENKQYSDHGFSQRIAYLNDLISEDLLNIDK